MNDAVFMRRFKRFGDLTRDRYRLPKRNRSLREAVGERRAFDELEYQGLKAARILEAMDSADTRVIERGEQLRFALETCRSIRIECEDVGQNLERDVTMELRVARPPDFAHPAGAKRGLNFVRANTHAGGQRHVLVEVESVCQRTTDGQALRSNSRRVPTQRATQSSDRPAWRAKWRRVRRYLPPLSAHTRRS